MKTEIRDIIDSYANNRNYFQMTQELKRYGLLEEFEQNKEEYEEYIDETWN